MQNKEIINKCKEVGSLLDSYNISSSFSILEKIAKDKNNFSLSDRLSRVKSTYRYMAEYMLNGNADDSRESVYADIIEQLRSISDSIIRDEISIDSSDAYSETFRMDKLLNQNIDSLISDYGSAHSEFTLASAAGNDTSEISRRLEDLHSAIFNKIWVSLNDKHTIQSALDAVLSMNYGERLGAHIISALTLSLLGFFDRYKLSALISIYQSGISEKISARSLVGIVFALNAHPVRVRSNKELLAKLSMMQDSIIDYRRVREVIMTIIRTRDTDRISTKMQNEVLPELMKLRPDILKQIREASPDMTETGMIESNPEWEELLDKSGLTEKMRELSDMQSEGADLMMVAFSSLKQFPFFYKSANWFLPFISSHSEISVDSKEREIIERLMDLGKGICDSDKYSLAFALNKMPSLQKEMMMSQLDAQFSQISEEMKEKVLSSAAPEFDEEVTKVVRDLYRYFKLFRKTTGVNDPFKKPLEFLEIPVIGDMMSDSEIVALVGEFYFRRKYYNEALSLFNLLLEENADDPALWEKAGVCYQSMKFYEKALECYSRAELLKTPSAWLLNKLAFANKKLGRFSDALERYKLLLENDPENLTLLLNAGYCALESANPQEGLKFYYHANYLQPDNISIYRAIAWSEFILGNKDKSLNYYDKILSSENADSTDYLNAGHLYAVGGEYRKALDFYQKAVADNYEHFRTAFIHDIPTLEKAGGDKESLLILLDYIGLEK